MDAATENHVLAQVGRLLDAEVIYENRKCEMDQMSAIDRLKGKLGQAAGVAQRTVAAIEAEADSLIAREDALKSKTAGAFAPHKAILDEAATELKAVEDALNLMTNGGPPLSDAGSTAPAAPSSWESGKPYPVYP